MTPNPVPGVTFQWLVLSTMVTGSGNYLATAAH
jgi:hypothetical protein